MRAWQASLADAPPKSRIYRPEDGGNSASSDCGWQRPANDDLPRLTSDILDEDPEIQVAKRDDIVPRRPGVTSDSMHDESLWSSHLFWKGIVVGAGIVLLAKIVMAVQAPFGIDWYGL
jgi:hypothetical protein